MTHAPKLVTKPARWNPIEYARILLHDRRVNFLFISYQAVVGLIRNTVWIGMYRAAVSMSIPWAAAYLWDVGKLVEKLSVNIESDNYDAPFGAKLHAEVVSKLDLLERFAPNLKQAIELRGTIALLSGRTAEWLAIQYQVFEFQEYQARLVSVGYPNTRILEPYFHILIGIGSTVHLDAYVKAGILGLRPPSRTVILHEPWLRRYAVNPCLLDYWRKYIDIVEDPAELRKLRPLRTSLGFNVAGPMQCGNKTIPWGHSAAVYVQQQWDNQMREPLLRLSDEHRIWGIKALNNRGVPPDAWIATVHVREGEFGAHRHGEPFRDADINTYLAAIEAITDRGGWVIRMGDSSMTPLPKMRNVIDYANDLIKSDWMDIFLCASARFMVGTSSGPSTISHAFGVPIAMTNYLPTATLYLAAQDLFIPKLLQRRADGSMVRFENQMSLPLSACASNGMYNNLHGVTTISNTTQEIRELVKEMMDKLDGNTISTPEDAILQNRFKTMTAECETLPGLPGFELQCNIGRHFLRRNRYLLETVD